MTNGVQSTGIYTWYLTHKINETSVKVNQANSPEEIILNKDEVTFKGVLKDWSGTAVGSIAVVGLRSYPVDPSLERNLDDVFSSLYVTKNVNGKEIILYKINDLGFFNTHGLEQENHEDKFFGYQFAGIFEDHFVIHILGDNGKSISDDLTVYWDEEKQIFKIMRPEEADLNKEPPTFINTLKTQDKSVLGQVYVTYLQKEKDVLDSLYIIRESSIGYKSIYTIRRNGFSPSYNKFDLHIESKDFHGFKLDLINNDYIVVHLLGKDGEDTSGPLTVKWNYEKEVFELQK